MSASVNLQDLIPEVRKVNIGKGDVQVFSLTVANLGVLLGKYGNTLEGFFTDTKPDLALLQAVAPDLVADIIAMGIKAEGQEDLVVTIPLAAQIEILLDIWELSVPDTKKLVAKLQSLLGSLQAAKTIPSLETQE